MSVVGVALLCFTAAIIQILWELSSPEQVKKSNNKICKSLQHKQTGLELSPYADSVFKKDSTFLCHLLWCLLWSTVNNKKRNDKDPESVPAWKSCIYFDNRYKDLELGLNIFLFLPYILPNFSQAAWDFQNSRSHIFHKASEQHL